MKAELYLDRGVERDCASWPDLGLGLKLEREAVDIPVAIPVAIPAYEVEQDQFRVLGEAVLRLPAVDKEVRVGNTLSDTRRL